MSSSITSKVLQCAARNGTISNRIVGLLRPSSSLQQQHQDTPTTHTDYWRKNAAAIAAAATVVAAGSGTFYSMSNEPVVSSCDTKAVNSPYTLPQQPHHRPSRRVVSSPQVEPPRRQLSSRKEPKNVMLHRMRSSAGRGMNDKYTVDWETVIGEGAYGSVHPARLRMTGEKVRIE